MRLTRRSHARLRSRSSEAKAAQDRHIGFQWLARHGRLPGEPEAEAVFRAAAREIGDCAGAGEARHIASHLPLGLRDIWVEETCRAGRPSHVGADELMLRLQSRLGLLHRAEAEVVFTLVCAWLKHLAPEERDDVRAVLSPEVEAL